MSLVQLSGTSDITGEGENQQAQSKRGGPFAENSWKSPVEVFLEANGLSIDDDLRDEKVQDALRRYSLTGDPYYLYLEPEVSSQIRRNRLKLAKL